MGREVRRVPLDPMHPLAPALSESEHAEVARFGIHDDDESEGVW
ncbi:hypothetical protein ACFY9N_11710 [Microbacterium sp. NPDC008134]